MASSKPLAGFGLETYSSAFPRYQSPELSRAYPAFYHESPHNAFLDILTEEGLAGLALFLALIVFAITAARSKHLTAIALVSFLACQQFNAWTIATTLYCYIAIALLVAESIPMKEGFGRGLGRPWRAAFCVLTVLFAVAGIRLWTADRMLGRTKALLAAGQLEPAAEQYKKARSWGAAADLWYSRSMVAALEKTPGGTARLFGWQEASATANRATLTAEDTANAWYNLAAFQAAGNNPAGTERSLREAISAAPNWFKPHWMLARLLFVTGRREEARREAETAAFLDAGKDTEVSRTLGQIRSAK